jgi:hypothetical protein
MATVTITGLGTTGPAGTFSTPLFSAPTTGVSYLFDQNLRWRFLAIKEGSVQLSNPIGTLGFSSPPVFIIAGIDPVIQYLLSVRLKTTGQIWPVGY